MRFRKFRDSDAKAVSQMTKDNLKNVIALAYSKRVIDAWLRVESTPKQLIEEAKKIDGFVAVDKGEIVGSVYLDGNQFRHFYVKRSHQGKGRGSYMVSQLEKVAKKRGYKEVQVKSVLNAVEFYEKCGFRKIKKVLINQSNIKPITFYEILMTKKIIS